MGEAKMTDERLEELRQIAGGVDAPKSEWMDELIAEIDRLHEIVGKLPKTADGVRVVPGVDHVFYPRNLADTLQDPPKWDIVELGVGGSWAHSSHAEGNWGRNVSECYSTHHAAAEAAIGRKP